MTSTTIAPSGSSARSKICCTVGTEIPARIRAGITVQTISSRVLPCVCTGRVSSPDRARYLTAVKMISPCTRTNTATAIQNVIMNRLSGCSA